MFMRKFCIVLLCFSCLSCGGSNTDSEEIQYRNKVPKVNAGENQTIDELSKVELNGTVKDSDGTIANYSWSQTTGTAVTLTESDKLNASFIAPDVDSDETLIFELSAIDDDGATVTDTVEINIKRVNLAPEVNAGENQTVDELSTVELNGTVKDSDGTITNYSWSQTTGTSVTLTESGNLNTSFTAPDINSDETLAFELSATDNDGATVTDTVEINIIPASLPPVSNAGSDQTYFTHEHVSLNCLGDYDSENLSFLWTQTSGPSVQLSNRTDCSSMFQLNGDEASYEFELEISNGDTSDTDSVIISSVKYSGEITLNMTNPFNLVSPYDEYNLFEGYDKVTSLSSDENNLYAISEGLTWFNGFDYPS